MSIKRKTVLVRNLLCFMEAAKYGTVSKAALESGMKQSNFSNCIKELEDTLQCGLFNRLHNGVVLTENGKKFFQVCCDLENILFKAEHFSTAASKISGDVRVWMSEGLGATYLSSCLQEFLIQYPDVHIDIFCSIDNPRIVQEADMAIVYDEPKQNDAVIISKNDLRFGLFASRDYLLKYGCPKDLDDLKENHKICNRDNFPNVWSEWREIVDNSAHVVTTTNSTSMLRRLTRDGIGISIHPLGFEKDKNIERILADKFELSHPFWIVSHAASKDVPKIRALINHIKKAAAQL